MKVCIVCKLLQPIDSFPVRSKASGRRRSYCYECQRTYCREYYSNNKNLYNARRYERHRRLRVEYRRRLVEYLRANPCVDCGERDFRVLEFDHVRGDKAANISDMMSRYIAWKRIENELAKCEVRCANCHRRKTALQFGWFSERFGT